MPFPKIPGVGAPCIRALEAAGFETLESLAGAEYDRLIKLHGVGQRGLERLNQHLIDQGLQGFSGKMPKLGAVGHKITRGHTGENAKGIKTQITAEDPVDYIANLPWERRIKHGKELLEIFNRATGAEPKMWGLSMIGYGEVRYESTSGRHGDWFLLGFSPRQAKISLYGLKDYPELLEKLGKYTEGKGCVYVNKLEDIDLSVLEKLIKLQWNREL